MAIGKVDDFLAVVERSKLLKPEDLVEVRRLSLEITDSTNLAKTLVRQNKLTRWQAGQLLAGRGTFFLGKYKLLELLGKGGMGSVFLGEHVMMNRRVALKIIPRHIGKDPAGLERFLAEARTIAALDHPNIVQAYSVDNEGDLYYLVMEYVDGLDLQRLVEAEGKLDCPSAVDYVRQAAEGLAHAHTRKMVHCDIKPSNLIVNPHGVVKILDMGLARLAGPEELAPEVNGQDERILGTVDYMAPEQALHSADFNHRADIYSLGCTLYFLLTGHAPFPSGSLPERILKHQTQQPAEISAERPDVPQTLIDICKKMMAKKPADRYQSAADLSQVLAAWRPGEHRVKRVLTLKKAESIDELPGPDVLGMDLSELFRKGIGVSTTAPIISRKPQETIIDKIKAAMRSAVSTPLRAIAALFIAGAAVVLFAIAIILLFSNKNEVTTAQGPGNESTGIEQPEKGGTTSQSVENDRQKPESNNTTNGKETPSNASGSEPPPPPPEPTMPVTSTQEGTLPQTTPPSETTPPEPSPPEPVPVEEPKIEPFKDLAKSVDLPELPKSASPENITEKTASLGTVVLPAGTTLQLLLIGGVGAVKGTDSVFMQLDINSRSSPLWQIYVDNPAKPIEIGQLKLRYGNLAFNWMPDVTPAYADALRRCGILAFVQGQQQFVQLCRTRQVKPLLLDLEKNISEVSLQIESLPDLHNLFVQITDREGPFPQNSLQPSDTLEVQSEDKSEITMDFTDPKYANFKIKITTEIAKGQRLDVKATAFYEIPGDKLKVFKADDAVRFLNKCLDNQSVVQAAFDKAPKGNPAKAKAAQKLADLKKQIDFLQDLNPLCQQLNLQGKIHYAVYILYGEFKVELFTTQVPVAEPSETKDTAQPSAANAEGESQQPKKPAKKPAKKKPAGT